MTAKVQTYSKQKSNYSSIDSNQTASPLISNVDSKQSAVLPPEKIIPIVKLQIFLVPFKQPLNQQFQIVCMDVSENCKIKEVSDYLQMNNKIQFNNYFFSSKPGQKIIIPLQRKIKDLKASCYKYKQSIVLVCYERQIDKQLQQALNTQDFQKMPKAGQLPQSKARDQYLNSSYKDGFPNNGNIRRQHKNNSNQSFQYKKIKQQSGFFDFFCCFKPSKNGDKYKDKDHKI